MIEILRNWLLGLLGNGVCPLCGAELPHEEDCLCIGCLRRLISADRRICTRCENRAGHCTCGTSAFPDPGLPDGRRILVHTFYGGYDPDSEDPTVSLLYTAKQHHRKRLYRYMALVLAEDIRNRFAEIGWDVGEWTCSFPPRSAKGYRKYGFDQGEEIARLLAMELGIPFCSLFVKRAGTEQKKAKSAAARQQNAEDSLFLKRGKVCSGRKILLFDDVITSGSTMLRASALLYEAGAACVLPVAYAKTNRHISPL